MSVALSLLEIYYPCHKFFAPQSLQFWLRFLLEFSIMKLMIFIPTIGNLVSFSLCLFVCVLG